MNSDDIAAADAIDCVDAISFTENGSASFLESSNGLTKKHSSLFEVEKLPISNGSRTKKCKREKERKKEKASIEKENRSRCNCC